MKRLLREPLLHFLLLGTVLFLADARWSKTGTHRSSAEIIVTTGRIEHLATGFAKTWQRPPTGAELKGLIDDWVREEIATREATALGLDQDDSVIRRRLRQKLEFISEDLAAEVEPTDADLAAWLHDHPDSFRVEPHFTFRQICFDPGKHGDHLADDVANVLARMNAAGASADCSACGDSLLLEETFQAAPAGEIAKQFGESFEESLRGLAVGQWQGPVESGYGVHLVLITERTESRVAELAEVRDAVRREWSNAHRLQCNGDFYRELSNRYTVTIEGAREASAPADARDSATVK
jgi:hypothetical protein